MAQYNGIQGTYFSFLPAHSKTGYECLLGAIEMGYNVDGYMIVTHVSLCKIVHLKQNPISTVLQASIKYISSSKE